MKRLAMILVLALILSSVAMGQTVVFEPNDATNVSVYFRAYDKTTGEPNVAPVLTDYKRYYTISGAAMDAGVALTALATAATAHTDNYAYHVGLGMVRVDYPDVAFAGDPGSRVYLQLVDLTGDDRFDPPFMIVQLSPPVNVKLLEEEPPSDSADLAGALWDAQTSSYATAGSTGEAVADAKTAAEKLDTSKDLLDAIYTLADKILKTLRY